MELILGFLITEHHRSHRRTESTHWLSNLLGSQNELTVQPSGVSRHLVNPNPVERDFVHREYDGNATIIGMASHLLSMLGKCPPHT